MQFNSRFSSLKESNTFDNKRESSQTNKFRTGKDDRQNKKEENRFISRQRRQGRTRHLPSPKKQFNILEENFPTLNINTNPTNPTNPAKKENYIEMIKTETKDVVPQIELPRGWTQLKLQNGKIFIKSKHTITANDIEENLERINYNERRAVAALIMRERTKHRNFLNEVLGDMSPYWENINIGVDDDSYDDYEYDSSDTDYEYNEY